MRLKSELETDFLKGWGSIDTCLFMEKGEIKISNRGRKKSWWVCQHTNDDMNDPLILYYSPSVSVDIGSQVTWRVK